MNVGGFPRRARYELRTWAADHPFIYMPLTNVVASRGNARGVRPGTEVVIEGWPRSANTFAETAFRMSQSRQIDMAHHFHAPAQVIRATRLELPTLVLVREPSSAVASFVTREPVIRVRQALRSWLRFYRRLVGYEHAFVVATFDQVTGDFGAVMQRLNDRFSCEFKPFVHSEEHVSECFAEIDRIHQLRFGGAKFRAGAVARPHEEREMALAQTRSQIDGLADSHILESARALFAEYQSWSERD